MNKNENKEGAAQVGKIAIVGSGAVGSYYGARLAQAGGDVSFLLRSDYPAVKERGLEIRSVSGDFSLNPVQCFSNSEDIGEVDLVIIAWKTTSNCAAKAVISPLVGKETRLLTLQNGLGNCEYLADLFGAHRVLGGLCFVCINRLRAGVISHTASGLIRIGDYTQENSAYVRELKVVAQQAEIPCEIVTNLEAAQWRKLIWNIPFNGLAIAEGGVDTLTLLEEKSREHEVRELMQEVAKVSEALGHQIPASFLEEQIRVTYTMGAYRPSSMIDYIEGRAVEYDAIWARPLEIAKNLGLSVPAMTELAQRVKQCIEQRNKAQCGKK